MPFVTKSGGLRLADGVVETHRDFDGNIVKGNNVPVKVMTNVGVVGMDSESEEFKMAVTRGVPRPNGTSWSTTPVFIIQHYEWDQATWERFLSKFEADLIPGRTSPSINYEPAIYDILDLEYGKRAFPLWVIEWLDEREIFEKALAQTKVESKHPKLNQQQYELIRQAIKNRITAEKEGGEQSAEELAAESAKAFEEKVKEQELAALREAAKVEAEKNKKLQEELRKEKEAARQIRAEYEGELAAKAYEEEQLAKEEAEFQELLEQEEAAKAEIDDSIESEELAATGEGKQ